MSKLTVADVLDCAADLIEPEGAWTQGAFSRNADGSIDHGGDEDPDGVADRPVCWCILGAIAKAANVDLGSTYFPTSGLAREAADALKVGSDVRRGWYEASEWNDAPERIQTEVVDRLREAAALAREQGK